MMTKCIALQATAVIPMALLNGAALAWVITSKYLDGQPLYRQLVLLGRFGGKELSRNTLASGVVRMGKAVQPVVNLLRDALLDSFIVHGDETEVKVLKEPKRRAKAKSCMWVLMTEAGGAEGRVVEPIFKVLKFAPSGYHRYATLRRTQRTALRTSSSRRGFDSANRPRLVRQHADAEAVI